MRYDENTNEHYTEDITSKHGVIINDRKIIQRTALKEGDQI
ncbi:MAG: FHA domain-containing protein [Planctomycetota bacterium]